MGHYLEEEHFGKMRSEVVNVPQHILPLVLVPINKNLMVTP